MKYILAVVLLVINSFAYSGDCSEVSIVKPTPFMGNDGEVVKLSDGSFWEIKYSYEYMYEYSPDAIICPKSGYLYVKGKKISVSKLQ